MVEENDSASGAATLPLHSRTNGKYSQMEDDQPAGTSNQQQDEDASFRQRVEALLLCAVCHETVTDPRELNCGHFFCSECVDLLNVDDIVKCALCGATTPVTEVGVRKHDLAAKLAALLEEFTKPVQKERENGDVDAPLMLNGTIHHEPALSEEETPESDNPPQTNGDSAPEDDQGTPDDARTSNQDETEPQIEEADERPGPDIVLNPASANIAVETDTPHFDVQKAPHSPEDNVSPQIQSSEMNNFTPVITAEVHELEDREITPPPPSPPAETVQEQDPSADITIEPPPPSELVIEPTAVSKPEEAAVVTPEEPPTEVTTADDSILQPPEDYQSPPARHQQELSSHSGDLLVEVDVEPLPPPSTREPIEHGEDSDEEKPASSTPTPEDTDEPDLKPLNTTDPPEEPSAPDAKQDQDETDYKMKPSEIKPSEVALAIESQRQCGTCHSSQCTCNSSSLLTPPVSLGSQQSVETNTSQNVSEDDDGEILVEELSRFNVKESASHIEVANKNKIHVTRWTYDDDGAIDTFDQNGKKVKCIHSGHQNFSGVTLSRLGFLFALNTSKNRIEEYGSADGRKVKNFKLDICSDPQAVDIMPSGEVLVVDQERHRIIVYPNNKRSISKPRAITHSLLREPYDIATTNGAFYVTCAATHCVLKMDLDGQVLWSYGQSDKTSKRFKSPQGVCVDEVGLVYVVDKVLNCIYVFNKDGQLKGRITDKGRGAMKRPWYVSVRDGLLAVLFSHNIVKTYQFA